MVMPLKKSQKHLHVARTARPLHSKDAVVRVKSDGKGRRAEARVVVKPQARVCADLGEALLKAEEDNEQLPRLLPRQATPGIEFARMQEMGRLRVWFRDEYRRLALTMGNKGKKKAFVEELASAAPPVMAFERWHFRALGRGHADDSKAPSKKANKTKARPIDPLLPTPPVGGLVDDLLVDDVARAFGVVAGPGGDAHAHRCALELARGLEQKSAAAATRVAHLQDDKVAQEGVTVLEHKHTCTVRLGSNTKRQLLINHTHLAKLRLLWSHFHPAESRPDGSDSDAFKESLFCLLARYHALGGHGYQAALGDDAFRMLRKELMVDHECFASPLNSSCRYYCSAFPDCDGNFGSAGSFFDVLKPGADNGSYFFNAKRGGSYEANPPFVSSVMLECAEQIDKMLELCDGTGAPCSFVVVVPGWSDEPYWKRLSSSRFLRRHFVVSRDDHGFVDGAQHQRKDRFRESPFDTAFFILQTEGHPRPVDDGLEERLREMMALSVPTAAMKQRRLAEGRGFGDLDGGGGVYKGKKKRKAAVGDTDGSGKRAKADPGKVANGGDSQQERKKKQKKKTKARGGDSR